MSLWKVDKGSAGLGRVVNSDDVYLDQGDAKSGLTHIVEKHAQDFERRFGVTSGKISEFLYTQLQGGEYKTYGYEKKDSSLAVYFQIQEQSFLFVVFNVDTGRIITAMPGDKNQANKSDF
eukprot:TRINITY_DN4081_c0_g1_i1.p1 TRINITY_DN4081_c0_g1~~TRINITY_DN4081_c0_g1_i1.p1  ORF type:complete len:120 (-),score=27.97 TRINITY_DN4081_c0_g1_i1:476-835(-)